MNKEIIDFYLDISHNGHPTISDVLYSDVDWLENCHTWCQRAFPNYEPSEIVPGSPVLDDETLEWIKNYKADKVNELIFKFLVHYQEVFLSRPFAVPHNNRRVTRLLKFLDVLGYVNEPIVVYNYCKGYMEMFLNNGVISQDMFHTTLDFWFNAFDLRINNE